MEAEKVGSLSVELSEEGDVQPLILLGETSEPPQGWG